MLVVYFSSVTNNTHRFVEKLGLPSARIPMRKKDPELIVDEPYILIVPTYGGGVSMRGEPPKPVSVQVIRFLNNKHNRDLIRGVIASGNLNFGPDYCTAGNLISAKCKVPFLYRFELLGTPDDVDNVRNGIINNAERLGLKKDDHRPAA